MTGVSVVRVEGDEPYEVLIGAGVLDRAASLVPAESARVALVHPEVMAPQAAAVAGELAARGAQVLDLVVPDGEAAKTAQTAALCWSQLAQAGFTRSDAVVGIGGGATTDAAGFIAATWLRGVAHVEVPTTLLGMVDAAVGGKTAINLPEGKNLVGSFHPPVGVACDLEVLATLPSADYAAGLAEVVKCGLIRDPRILDLIEGEPEVARAGSPVERELVTRSVQVKADVVSGDLREATTGFEDLAPCGLPRVPGREVLNYGHTLGHAIEQAEAYQWRHGDAISVGMVFAAELAHAVGLIDQALVDRHRALLGGLGLPVAYDGDWGDLLRVMGRDKKTRGSTMRFIVLAGVGEPVLLTAPPEEALRAAFAAVSG